MINTLETRLNGTQAIQITPHDHNLIALLANLLQPLDHKNQLSRELSKNLSTTKNSMYTVNEVGCLLEFPAFKGRHFSLKVLNSPQVMHHEPFVKTLTYLCCMAEPKIISMAELRS